MLTNEAQAAARPAERMTWDEICRRYLFTRETAWQPGHRTVDEPGASRLGFGPRNDPVRGGHDPAREAATHENDEA